MFQTSSFKVFLLYPLNIEKMLQELWGKIFFFKMFLFGFLLLCMEGMSAAYPTYYVCSPSAYYLSIRLEPHGSFNTIEINNLLGVAYPYRLPYGQRRSGAFCRTLGTLACGHPDLSLWSFSPFFWKDAQKRSRGFFSACVLWKNYLFRISLGQ